MQMPTPKIPDRQIPAGLESCQVLQKLHDWKFSSIPEARRAYEIRSWDKFVKVTLTWRFAAGDSIQMATINKIATSAEEAVWLALEEFAAHVARGGK